MKKLILNRDFKIIKTEEAEPKCGEDFCDECGDCLHCYGGDPCYNGGEHIWIVYDWLDDDDDKIRNP